MKVEKKDINNSTILVTGGTGSWGTELISQLLSKYNPKEIRVFSRGEHKQVEMKLKFADRRLNFVIGNITDERSVDLAMRNVDYVFHLAALKHVPICEQNPWEAVKTNIIGTQNVIDAAISNKVKVVIDISTDKAVDPFNHYGVTKACGERLIINANSNYSSETKFICIRGGNVMGTNGSVLPLFKNQILNNQQITITDDSMTRYLMSTKEAIQLIFKAFDTAAGGEIFVMRMKSTTVKEMAESMLKIMNSKDKKIKVIGCRPGEKMHEVLVSKNESPFTKILDKDYFVILPQTDTNNLSAKYAHLSNVDFDEFTSENAERFSNNEFINVVKKEDWFVK